MRFIRSLENMSPNHWETSTIMKMFNSWWGFLVRPNHWRQCWYLHGWCTNCNSITIDTLITTCALCLELFISMNCLMFPWTMRNVSSFCLVWLFQCFTGTWVHGQQHKGILSRVRCVAYNQWIMKKMVTVKRG